MPREVGEMGVCLKVDRSEAQWILADHVARAQRLVTSGERVGDREEFDFWRLGRRVWTESTAERLAAVYEAADVVGTFERITRVPPSLEKWSEDLPLEVERIREGIEMLQALERGLKEAVEPSER
jgi:hypothetical protein